MAWFYWSCYKCGSIWNRRSWCVEIQQEFHLIFSSWAAYTLLLDHLTMKVHLTFSLNACNLEKSRIPQGKFLRVVSMCFGRSCFPFFTRHDLLHLHALFAQHVSSWISHDNNDVYVLHSCCSFSYYLGMSCFFPLLDSCLLHYILKRSKI